MTVAQTETATTVHIATWLRPALVGLFLLGIWLFSHPWCGICYDGQLYAFQAIHHLRPDVYRNDLFFLFGSQDDYTLFSPIYAAAISISSLETATLALLLATYVLWIASAVWLARRMIVGFPYWLGLALVLTFPRGYGGTVEYFRYAEPYLTPRPVAEGLTLLAIGLTLRGQWKASLAASAAAFTMHPIIALAGAGFIATHAVLQGPRSARGAVALAISVFLALAALDVGPFGRFLSSMDAEWFALTFARSPFAFWDGWKVDDWLNRCLLSFSILATASVAARDAQRRFFLAALLLGFAALLLTWLGTSVFHNVLIIQIQPWRMLWLVHLLSWLAAAWLAGALWHRGQTHRLLLLCFLGASLALDHVGGALALLAAAGLVWQLRMERELPISRTGRSLLGLVLPVTLLLSLAITWQRAAVWTAQTADQTGQSIAFPVKWLYIFLAGGGSGLAATALLLTIWRYSLDERRAVRLSAAACSFLCLFLSIGLWYRSSRQHDLEQRHFEQWHIADALPEFSRHIHANAVVYWEDMPTATWFVVKHANYASRLQLAGLAFSRRTAIEGRRRIDRLTTLGVTDGIFELRSEISRLPTPSMAGLLHLCHDPVLDYAILAHDFGTGVLAEYFDENAHRLFRLYDCADLRQRFDDPWPDRQP